MDDLTTKSLSELKAIAGHQLPTAAYRFGVEILGDKRLRATWVDFLDRCRECGLMESSADADRPQEPLAQPSERIASGIEENSENTPGVDRPQEPIEIQRQEPRVSEAFTGEGPPNRGDGRGRPAAIDSEFPDMESALAEIARLRAKNGELTELARSQSEIIRRAKDVSPVEKPSLKRVVALAEAAFLDISKAVTGGWILSMGNMKREFKRLRQIWELLVAGDWYLTDLFYPPPNPKIVISNSYTKYSSIPFCDDDLIDIWSLGFVNAAAGDRAPPAEAVPFS